MTTTIAAPPAGILTRFGWHRPLLWLSCGMILAAAAALVGLLVDHRTITGMPLWTKPLKFSLSIFLYSVTLSWLLGMLRRGRRAGWWAGTVAAVFLAVEMVVISGAAFADTTSHFNLSTPLSTAL